MIQFDFNSICLLVKETKVPDFNKVINFFAEKTLNDHNIIDIAHNVSSGCNKHCKSTDKTVYIVTGGIASGKSTVTFRLINSLNLVSLSYISSDSFYKVFYKEHDFDSGYEKARELTDCLLDTYCENNKSFIWETVFSKDKKREFLKRLKKEGYTIVCIYVSVEDETIVESRSVERTNYGYHSVPLDFIKDRQKKSRKALEWLLPMCDKFCLLENSGDLSLIVYIDEKTLYIDKAKIAPDVRNQVLQNAIC